MTKQGYVYILTNKNHKVLYVGVTSNLIKRMYEHKNRLADGFTKRYNCEKLVYFETSESIISAIEREKQLKAGSRLNKVKLIESINLNWNDLYETLI